MKFNNLEDKCQYYRGLTDYKVCGNNNILVMLDGKNFSTLIKNNFKKPFDDEFINMMNRTAQFLCNNVQGVKFAYVQSDEISLLITDYDTPETDTPFGGRICKLQSILASLATSEFNRWFTIWNLNKCYDNVNVGEFISKMKMAQFDCKVWTVPNQNDAYAWFLYRQLDCIKNSKQQTAQTYLPHKQLLNHDADEQIEMTLNEKGINWNKFEDKYKYGRFVYKIETTGVAKDNKGNDVEYVRNKFTVVPAFVLSNEEGKNKFYDEAFRKYGI
ncbi:MAG: tRNA(His) guanylyltransferase Thg1 family protein [Clostridia bacterium]|nr:tRNA(His) guanylyltransferase Thg1 family protein [Clostridia bacterium]